MFYGAYKQLFNRGYEGSDASSCGGTVTAFEAYAEDFCFSDDSSSFSLQCPTSGQIDVSYCKDYEEGWLIVLFLSFL